MSHSTPEYPLAPETYLSPIEVREDVATALRDLFASASLEQTGALAFLLASIKQQVQQRADELFHDAEHGTPLSSRTEDAVFGGQAEGLVEAAATITDCFRQLGGLANITWVNFDETTHSGPQD